MSQTPLKITPPILVPRPRPNRLEDSNLPPVLAPMMPLSRHNKARKRRNHTIKGPRESGDTPTSTILTGWKKATKQLTTTTTHISHRRNLAGHSLRLTRPNPTVCLRSSRVNINTGAQRPAKSRFLRRHRPSHPRSFAQGNTSLTGAATRLQSHPQCIPITHRLSVSVMQIQSSTAGSKKTKKEGRCVSIGI